MIGPNPDIAELAKELNDIRKRLDSQGSGSRSDRLPYAAIQLSKGQGGIALYDGNTIKGFMGSMPDGTVNFASVNNPVPPAVPLKPVVVASIGGATVYARKDPDISLPWDHSHFNVYVNDVNIGTLQLPPDSLPIGPLPYNTPAGVQLTSVNLSGTESDKTDYVYVTPLKVVGDDILDGVISTLKIANNAIKDAQIDLNAVTTTKIADDAISTPKIISGAITTDKIIANAITSDKIVANAITSDKIAANAITADDIQANAITAGKIQAGAVTADKFASIISISNRFVAGNFEMNTNGIIATDSNGVVQFSVDSAGNVLVSGVYRTAPSGNRITINELANSIRFYPSSDSNASARIFASGSGTNAGISMQTSQFSLLSLSDFIFQFYMSTAGGGGGIQLQANVIYLRTGPTNATGLLISNNPGPLTLLRSGTNNTAIQFSNTGLDIYNAGGGGYLAVGASDFVKQSSEEVKENIRNLDFDPVQAIMDAPGKMYEMKDDPSNTNIGPIAEQLPEFITVEMNDGVLGVSLDGKIGVVWSATEQLAKRVERLEKRLLSV